MLFFILNSNLWLCLWDKTDRMRKKPFYSEKTLKLFLKALNYFTLVELLSFNLEQMKSLSCLSVCCLRFRIVFWELLREFMNWSEQIIWKSKKSRVSLCSSGMLYIVWGDSLLLFPFCLVSVGHLCVLTGVGFWRKI